MGQNNSKWKGETTGVGRSHIEHAFNVILDIDLNKNTVGYNKRFMKSDEQDSFNNKKKISCVLGNL